MRNTRGHLISRINRRLSLISVVNHAVRPSAMRNTRVHLISRINRRLSLISVTKRAVHPSAAKNIRVQPFSLRFLRRGGRRESWNWSWSWSWNWNWSWSWNWSWLVLLAFACVCLPLLGVLLAFAAALAPCLAPLFDDRVIALRVALLQIAHHVERQRQRGIVVHRLRRLTAQHIEHRRQQPPQLLIAQPPLQTLPYVQINHHARPFHTASLIPSSLF